MEAYEYFVNVLSALTPGQHIIDALGDLLPGLTEPDIREVIDRNDAGAIVAAASQWAALTVPAEALRANRVPTLVIMGELDEFRPDIDALVEILAEAQTRVLPGLDHISVVWSPLFRDALRTFVTSHSS